MYLLEISQALRLGNCFDELNRRSPGTLKHSRLLTTANRVLRLYQWAREGTVSRRPVSGRPRGATKREDRVRRMVVVHRTVSAAEIRAAVGTSVTQRTVTNRLLQGQLRARRPVACIPLTPNHCRLRRE
ncbi:hypothetical protein AVEN_247689-1 [Araneus ventricosus]|uniref:Transposase Tc1-like domain-containing protein n=1 Tax=Araneus ventricosus TaxID=182803 RepID=A0A4Y2GMX3_ARAVE|nr:hypothetical protein AVEN_247689-1 [Araneus ventricosus]